MSNHPHRYDPEGNVILSNEEYDNLFSWWTEEVNDANKGITSYLVNHHSFTTQDIEDMNSDETTLFSVMNKYAVPDWILNRLTDAQLEDGCKFVLDEKIEPITEEDEDYGAHI